MAAKKKINAKQAGSPGKNLSKPTQPKYLKVGGEPAYVPEPAGTVPTNPKNNKQMVDGALRVANQIGIYARKGGNVARKADCDPYSADALDKLAKSNSWGIPEK